jgi:hypothetical protein
MAISPALPAAESAGSTKVRVTYAYNLCQIGNRGRNCGLCNARVCTFAQYNSWFRARGGRKNIAKCRHTEAPYSAAISAEDTPAT